MNAKMKNKPYRPQPRFASTAAPAKPSPQVSPVKSAASVAGSERFPTPTAPPKGRVNFTLQAPQAKEVSLCGEFNQWTPTATPLKRRNDGRWEAMLALGAGRYEYKYLVDGQWTHDPKAQEQVTNPHGSLNSVIVIEA